MNLWPDASSIAELSSHQREQAALALSGPVGILAGTPGTGKTYTVAAIVRAVIAEHGADQIAVCCPTGKAAVRCNAAMHEYELPVEACTLHRLLAVSRNGYDGKGWGFYFNEDNPLPYRFVFVDEVSMLDTDTAASLFRALKPGTHVLLVGDPYQLPPVGHGAPFRDLILADVPYGELTEIKRNAGDVVRVCRELKEGKPYRPSQSVNVPAGRNLMHVECERPASAINVLRNLIGSVPASLDPMWDVQVLCAVNAKSDLGRASLNRMLQGLLNPNGRQVPGNPFRLGDKVICTSNTLLPVVEDFNRCSMCGEPQFETDSGVTCKLGHGGAPPQATAVKDLVANGEIGKVVKVEPKLMHVAFDAPERTVLVPLGKGGDDGENGEGSGQGSNGSGKGKFDLAYAITAHKSQGSQWPVVIVLIDDHPGAGHVASREWYYTALSRLEVLGITIGKKQTLNRHCRKVALATRRTFLKELVEAG